MHKQFLVRKYERKRALARTRRKWRTLKAMFEAVNCIFVANKKCLIVDERGKYHGAS